MRSDLTRNTVLEAALAVLVAFVACVLLIAAFASKFIIEFAILGAVIAGVGLFLSGNPRLFSLWGMVLAAPLGAAKGIAESNPHMGGVSSFRLEPSDPFLLLLLFFILRDFYQGHRTQLRLSKVCLFWGAMIAMAGVGISMGPYRLLAAKQAFQMGKELLLFLVIVHEVVRVKQFQQVAMALMLAVLFQSCVAILQYVMNTDLGLQKLGESDWETVRLTSQATLEGGAWVYRVGALIGHPNTLAAFYAMLLPIGIGLLFVRMKLINRVICATAATVGTVVLILTLSRTGWIAFACSFTGVMVLTMLHPSMRKRYLLARAGVVAVVLLVAVAFSGPITKRILHSDPNAFNVRGEFLETAMRMVKAHPVLGFGLNSYVYSMPAYTRYGSPSKVQARYGPNWPIVHNIYALVWAELGTVGLVLFILLQGYILLTGIRNLRVRNDVMFGLNIGCLCGVGAILVDGFASFFLRIEHCARVYWIVVGLIFAIHYWRKANESSPPAIES